MCGMYFSVEASLLSVTEKAPHIGEALSSEEREGSTLTMLKEKNRSETNISD